MGEWARSFRLVYRAASNFRRGWRKPPDYVYFVLGGTLPLWRGAKRKWWQNFVEPKAPLSLEELAERFDRLAAHKKVRGVILHLRELSLPPARLQALQDSLRELRRQGKRMVVWSTHYQRTAYQIAMEADQVLLQEGGNIGVLGISSQHTYLGDSLAWAGLKMDAVQISPYKSAADRLARADMSDEVRDMNNWMLDSFYGVLKEDLARGRRVTLERAAEIIDASPFTAEKAVQWTLVDGLLSEEELPRFLSIDGRPAVIEPWGKASRSLPLLVPTRRDACLGLIKITGSIVDGASDTPPIKPPIPVPFLFGDKAGDLTVVAQARAALKDKRIKGVLVYVDSGGGSATASEAMYQALAELAAHKPVVALMGSVAASGGYYVTTAAHWVIAARGTVTGSIGVLTGKLVDGELAKRLLANRVFLSRGESALLESSDREYTVEERHKEWESISAIYALFLRRVARARRTTTEKVDAVGGGRVWTGEQALAHGLIDELGGLPQALARLHASANVKGMLTIKDFSGVKHGVHLPSASSALSYAWESMKLFDGRALCLCPLDLLVEDDA